VAVTKSRKDKDKKRKKKNVFAHIGKLVQILYHLIAENDENGAQTSEMRMIDKNQPSQTK